MSARRLLGYIVKMSDGTRHTEGPLSLLDAVSISHGSVPPTHVVPVFSKPKPAPVVAAEGLPTRFALPSDFVPKMRARIRDHDGACGCVECVAYCLGFADCEDEVESKSKTRRRKSTVEAIEAARREERERVLKSLRRLYKDKTAADGMSPDGEECFRVGVMMSIQAAMDEAAKGQAK